MYVCIYIDLFIYLFTIKTNENKWIYIGIR